MKGGADVQLAIRATRHGPVLSDVNADLANFAGPEKAVALAFTGLGDRDTTGRSHDAGQFRAKLGRISRRAPPLSDADPELRLCRRRRRHRLPEPRLGPLAKVRRRASLPVDGASGAFDWTGTIPFDQWPQLHNPETGFAFNANNANFPDDHKPSFGQDWEENFRARRIQQFFDAIDKHSLETSAAMQADHLSLDVKDLQPFIAMIAPSDERARKAQAMLLSWNAVMDKDRAEPLIYTAFLRSLHKILIEDKTGLADEGERPVRCDDPRVADARPSSWCDSPGAPDPDCRKALGRALDDATRLARQARRR